MPGKLLSYHVTTIRDPGHGFTHPLKRWLPDAQSSLKVHSCHVTYPTQKHCCIPSFRTPHHRQALLLSYSRAVLLQVSLLPEHSQPHCVTCALEAFTRDSAGQQFDRAAAQYQDLKQRQHLHGTPSMLLLEPVNFRDHRSAAVGHFPHADLLCLCTDTNDFSHSHDHRPETVARRWCSSSGCGAEHSALMAQEDKE